HAILAQVEARLERHAVLDEAVVRAVDKIVGGDGDGDVSAAVDGLDGQAGDGSVSHAAIRQDEVDNGVVLDPPKVTGSEHKDGGRAERLVAFDRRNGNARCDVCAFVDVERRDGAGHGGADGEFSF